MSNDAALMQQLVQLCDQQSQRIEHLAELVTQQAQQIELLSERQNEMLSKEELDAFDKRLQEFSNWWTVQNAT